MLELWSVWVCSFSITLLITLGNMLHSDWVMTSPCGCGLIIWVSFLKLLLCLFSSSHFSLWSPGPVRGGWARRWERGRWAPAAFHDQADLRAKWEGLSSMSLQICLGTSTWKVKTLVLEDGTAFTTWVRCSLRAARVWGARDTNEKTWTLGSKTEDVSVAKATYNLHIQKRVS